MQDRILVLGLGNPILTDDAVGLLVAREVGRRIGSGIEIAEASVAGFDLIEAFSGYDRVIVIDSIQTPGGSPGAIYRLVPEDLPATERLTGAHEIDLATAIALGRRLGMPMPRSVMIVAVEVQDNRTFGESCTPDVAAAVETAAGLVIEEALSDGHDRTHPGEEVGQGGSEYQRAPLLCPPGWAGSSTFD